MVVKERLEPNRSFKFIHFKPGDQPNAIKELVSGINFERNQVCWVLLALAKHSLLRM